MNDLFVKNFDANISDAKGSYLRRIASPEIKRPRCQRVAAIDIYMLCPQHGFLFQGSDVERFINWVSELHVDTQRTRRTEYKHWSGYIEHDFVSIASVNFI